MSQTVDRIVIDSRLVDRLVHLQESIHQTMEMVAFGLSADSPDDSKRMVLPGIPYQLSTSRAVARPRSELRSDYHRWLLSNGFGELIEHANLYLDTVHDICATLIMADDLFHGRIDSEEMAARVESIENDSRRFHKAPLPRKIGHLRKEYSDVLETKIEGGLLSINAARNCFVHRRGLVAEGVDCEEGQRLVVRWIGLVVESYDKEGNIVRVEETGDPSKPGLYMFGSEVKEKRFSPGQRVDFTALEFNELALTVFVYAKVLASKVIEYAVSEFGTHLEEEDIEGWKRATEIYLFFNADPSDVKFDKPIPVDWRDGRLRFGSSVGFG